MKSFFVHLVWTRVVNYPVRTKYLWTHLAIIIGIIGTESEGTSNLGDIESHAAEFRIISDDKYLKKYLASFTFFQIFGLS